MIAMRVLMLAGSICILFLIHGGASATTEEASPARAVEMFEAVPYCQRVDREAALTLPAEVSEALDPANAATDKYILANSVLTAAAIEIAHASVDPSSCQIVFEEGLAQFRAAHSQAMANVRESRRHRFDRRDPIRSIQQVIADLWQKDQAGRSAYLALQTDDRTGPQFWAARLSVANAIHTDETSKRYLEGVLKNYEWIDSKTFGQVYADHAWILVQHADDYPEFQAEVLERMQPLVQAGGVRPKHYAYLYDRVAVNTGRPQRYGTQPIWECEDGKLSLAPLEDSENVNARREEMGMGSVETALAAMSRDVCGAA